MFSFCAFRPLRLMLAVLGLISCCAPGARAADPSPQLKALQDSARSHYEARRYGQALAAARQVLALTVQEFGRDHEQAGIQTFSVGTIAEALGDLALAEDSYRESVRIREIVYGPESAGTAMALEKLGGVLLKADRAADAEPVFERALKIFGDLIKDHAFSAGAHAGIAGSLLLAQEAHEEAKQIV